jgi:hypothetical protein
MIFYSILYYTYLFQIYLQEQGLGNDAARSDGRSPRYQESYPGKDDIVYAFWETRMHYQDSVFFRKYFAQYGSKLNYWTNMQPII